jgi:glycine/D-amino acid oxidase-like deaminating enzyme
VGYRSISYWFDSLGSEPEVRPPVPGDLEVDVAIVGAGFTGLWTAYYLMLDDPSLRVAVIERETAGFGASGRNGGWCAAMLQGLEAIYRRDPRGGAALREAIKASVVEVGAVCELEEIDAEFHQGGGLVIATNEPQASRLRETLKHAREIGWTAEDMCWLEPGDLQSRIRVASAHGAVLHAKTAAVNPAKLARGLADAAERRGAVIYEQTTVTKVSPGQIETDRGQVRAPRIVLALNAYATGLPRHRRDMLPVYNHMFATEPLPAATWDEIGLSERGLFGDAGRMFFYAQRTADDRIAIGGGASRYHYGSAIEARFDRDARVERALLSSLREMLPQLADFEITHRWGGVLGMPRDLTASVEFDDATGIGRVGSYTGEGVCASNLAGRTLRDLLLGRDSRLVGLPWVGHRSRRWEPEPLRWTGVQAGLALSQSADRFEARTGRRSPLRERLLRTIGVE